MRTLQSDVPEYTSAQYWQEHPEHQALLETAVGLLRMMGTEVQRLEERSLDDRDPDVPRIGELDSDEEVPERLFTESIGETLETIQAGTGRYRSAEFWDQSHRSRATLVSGLTALRLLLTRLNQSLDVQYATDRPAGEAATGGGQAREADSI